MKDHSKSLRIYKHTIVLGLPIIIQEVLNAAVNLADGIMIGRLGNNPINAVGVGNEIVFLFILIVFGIVSGSAAFMGQFWGKKDIKSVHKTMGLSFTLSYVAAAVFFTISQIFAKPIVSVYIKDPEAIFLGVKFLKIISYTFLLSPIILTINASLRSIGQTMFPMASTFAALVSNVILNYIFIFVLGKGVEGAAIATVIARIIELITQYLLIRHFKMPIVGTIKDYFSFDKKFVREYIAIVTPVILNEAVWAAGVTLYKVAYGNLGSDAFSAIQITMPIQQSFMVFGIGLGSATGILIANSLGAGDRDLAIEYSRKSTLLAVSFSVVMSVMLIIFAPYIINFYNVTDAAKGYGMKIIYVIAIGMIFKTYNYTAIVGILRNGGDTIFCLIIDMASVWCFGVPLAFAGSYIFNLPVYFVFLLAYAEEFSKFAFCFLRVKSNNWANSIVSE